MRIRMFVLTMAVMLLAAWPAPAQQNEPKSEISSAAAKQQPPKHHYKLHFILKETDNGTVINQRSFTLGMIASTVREGGDRASVRAGTRVPVGTNDKGVEYVDIGTDLDVYNAVESPEGLQMFVNAAISSAATDTPPTSGATAFRQVRASSAVLAPIGKPTMVFNTDDPASKHKFELDVTAVLAE